MNPSFRQPTREDLIPKFARIQNDVDLNWLCYIMRIPVKEIEDYQEDTFGFVPERIHNQGKNPFGFPAGNVTARVFYSAPLTQDQIHRINDAGADQAAVDAILREQIGSA